VSASRRINRRLRRSDRKSRAYARTLADIWAIRQDARGLAMHLRDALPDYANRHYFPESPVYTGGIYQEKPEDVAQFQHDDDPARTLRFTASLAGAVSFWVTDQGQSGKTFDVYVVERKRPW
jgi:hypothetical protein